MATTTRPNPLYAVAGAADIAVERLRELPGRIAQAVSDDRLRTELRTRFNGLPAEAKALRAEFPGLVKDAPAKAAEIPDRMREYATQASNEAAKTYSELAERGEIVVAKFRHEHGDDLDQVATSVRGRVADAADEIAVAADKIADDLGATAKKKPAAARKTKSPKEPTA